MRLNCDLGESYGSYTMGMDAEVMPHIHLANVACGFHGGDPLTLQRTLTLAARHGVTVGAHPSYPDLIGFGRRSMHLSREELVADILYQVAALDGMAASTGVQLEYIKPHGALYNDMMANAEVREGVMQAVATYHRPLKLMLLATPGADQHRDEAEQAGVSGLLFEAFADRCYDDDGSLLSRRKPGAVHDRESTLTQVRQLLHDRSVTSISGHRLALEADTICVHGDNIEGVRAIEAIRAIVDEA
ncbi:5-oxoprolinase subunit PxpA [Parahaliea maris]|uniref:5-oxoprolinase subunit PxpA n=1 Tax=Parahaliea maris TaxID=2716870 RepID=A0A5C8ZR49_9GAMM|nr:5-oxoprolinase subunit PxpA [Parahaliea maris]TXS90209.1 5-oxoprolinase subunit PxpA [Parahaliea maris]